jgi:hypothetical protein
MRLLKTSSNAGQSVLEYAILIVCVIAALLAMRVYVQRSFMGHLRSATDELGQQQYDYNKTFGTHNSSYQTKTTTKMYLKSEVDLGFNLTTGQQCGGSTYCSPDVFGTETSVTLNRSSQTENINETTAP